MRGRRLGALARTSLPLVCAFGLIRCAADTEDPGVGTIRQAIGEPQNSFPSWTERVVLVWTNRARCDPHADLTGCTVCAEKACYRPVNPLFWRYDLARSSRFHCANLVNTGAACLQHPSPCTLVSNLGTLYTPRSCNGAPSCACVGGSATCGTQGTTVQDRFKLFGYSGNDWGENIARGNTDPVTTFYQWFYEPENSSACGFRSTNGHRYNILSGTHTEIGTGNVQRHWAQDFGAGATPSKIVSGVHYPQTGTSISFRANWIDGAAPLSANVNVDGTCSAMSVERGVGRNGTYFATVTASSGCRHYYFEIKDSGGTTYSYPSTGSFGISCANDWDSTRPGGCGAPDGGSDGGGADGSAGAGGAAGAGGSAGAGGAAGAGGSPCSPGYGDCDGNPGNGCEANLNTDVAHCGACPNACSSSHGTPSCTSGACGITCNAGYGNCDGNISTGCEANLNTDVAHCGACPNACSSNHGTPSCTGGACGITCNAGYGNCDGNISTGCEANLNTDVAHCGDCATVCPGGGGAPTCSGGKCGGSGGSGGTDGGSGGTAGAGATGGSSGASGAAGTGGAAGNAGTGGTAGKGGNGGTAGNAGTGGTAGKGGGSGTGGSSGSSGAAGNGGSAGHGGLGGGGAAGGGGGNAGTGAAGSFGGGTGGGEGLGGSGTSGDTKAPDSDQQPGCGCRMAGGEPASSGGSMPLLLFAMSFLFGSLRRGSR